MRVDAVSERLRSPEGSIEQGSAMDDTVVTIGEHIRTVVRIRPLNKGEKTKVCSPPHLLH